MRWRIDLRALKRQLIAHGREIRIVRQEQRTRDTDHKTVTRKKYSRTLTASLAAELVLARPLKVN